MKRPLDMANILRVESRFWSRVTKADGDACWTWTGVRLKRPNGELSYGTLSINKRATLAHRYAWMLVRGLIEPDVNVCHRCDNVSCVRIDHLFIGTQADNLADMRAKGRGHTNAFPSGPAHPNAKITAEIASQIREERAASGLSFVKLGERFGLHPTTVHAIVRGKIWSAA